MNYRFQEILRYCIPGLYLIAMVAFLTIDSIIGNPLTINKEVLDICKTFSSVIVLLLPFVGFALGYIIECVMAIFERLLYRIGFPRPSFIVLRNITYLYQLHNVEDIKTKIGIQQKCSNKEARDAFQKAKQLTERTKYEHFYISSIMARNILGAQLMSGLGLIKLEPISRFTVIIFIALSFLFMLSWYHRNCVYAKNVFAEYSKNDSN